MAWTEQNVQMLRKYWAEGLSASQIARNLGGMTRNAVIGKVHRLGLAGRATPSRPVTQRVTAPRPRAVPAKPKLPRLVSENRPVVVIPEIEPLRNEDGKLFTVETIKSTQCRYGIGDPADAGFGFCGHHVAKKDTPWCLGHRQIVYQPSETRAEQRERQRAAQRYETIQINGARVQVAKKAA